MHVIPSLTLGIIVSLLLLVITTTLASASTTSSSSKKHSGQKKQKSFKGKCKKIVAHLIPHTHNDVMWLKTSDAYLYGKNNTIQPAAVNLILDSVIGGLLAQKTRKFTYVEQYFFHGWWTQQTPETQALVRQLVAEDRLQFANGGVCMADQASPVWTSFILNSQEGHRFLKRIFPGLVTIPAYWAIDPFGSGNTIATLAAKIHKCVNKTASSTCFPSTHMARIDYRDYQYRAKNLQREMWWTGDSKSLGEDGLFTQAFVDETYGPPSGFQWSGVQDLLQMFVLGNTDDFIVDDIESSEYNVPRRVADFHKVAEHYASVTAPSPDGTTHVMILQGSDFEYEVGSSWFVNIDKLVKYVNLAGPSQASDGSGCIDVEAHYSTPNDYVTAKAAAATMSSSSSSNTNKNASSFPNSLPQYRDADFFPYADSPGSMWSGYFTSRPSQKRMIIQMGAYWQASTQLRLLLGLPTGDAPDNGLAWAISNQQHHDTISGTCKQNAVFDAQKILHGEYAKDASAIAAARRYNPFAANASLLHCPLLNESVCEPIAYNLKYPGVGDVPVVVWNPGRNRTMWLTLPVPHEKTMAGGGCVVGYANVVPAPVAVSNYQTPNKDSMPYSLMVKVELPAAGYGVLFLSVPEGGDENKNNRHDQKQPPPLSRLKRSQQEQQQQQEQQRQQQRQHPSGAVKSSLASSGTFSIKNSRLELIFNNATNMLVAIVKRYSGIVIAVEQDFCYYEAWKFELDSKQKQHRERHKQWRQRRQRKFRKDRPVRDETPDEVLSFQSPGAYVMRNRIVGKDGQASCIPVGAGGGAKSVKILANYSDFAVLEQDWGWVKSRITLTEEAGGESDFFDIDFTVLGVPIDDGRGKEVFARLRTNISNSGEFTTADSSRGFLQRKLNARPSWPGPFIPTGDDPVASNMYPSTAIFMQTAAPATTTSSSSAPAIGIVGDSSAAVGSTANGELLFEIHRRQLEDDLKGVFECLNETQHITPYLPGLGCFVDGLVDAVEGKLSPCGRHSGPPLIVRGKLRVVVGTPRSITVAVRDALDDLIVFSQQLFFLPYNWTGTLPPYRGSLLAGSLDPQLQIATLQLVEDGMLILRIAHKFAVGEIVDPWNGRTASPVAVNLSDFFSSTLLLPHMKIHSILEMSLSTLYTLGAVLDPTHVVIKPMDIRTFEIRFSRQ